MIGSSGGRAVRALALAALTAPAVLLAHLAVSGAPPPPLAALAVTALALLAGALAPARGSGLGAGALLVGGSLFAGNLALTLPSGAGGCLPATWRGAGLAVRIGLYGEQGCPPGTFAAGTLSRAAIAALLTAGVLLAGHLLLAATGAWLLEGTRRAAEGCAGLVRALAALLRHRLPALPRIPVAARPRPRPRELALPVPAAPVPAAVTHRGPPLLARV